MSSCCLGTVTCSVLWLFLTVPWVGLQRVFMVYPEYTHFQFLFLFLNKMLLSGWKSLNIKQRSPWSDCFFRSSLIWVCAVCLPLCGRQLVIVFKILGHLPYMSCTDFMEIKACNTLGMKNMTFIIPCLS